jgi:amino acid transporter
MTTLRKVLKLRTVISTSVGMALATSCYLAGLQVATIVVGELAWISILVAGFFCLLSAMCLSELTSLYPSAAAIKLYIQNAFNERIAITIGMFYVVLGISMVGAESYILSSVMINAHIFISPMFDRIVWSSIFILFVAFLNYRGVKITGLAEDIMTFSKIGLLAFVSIYAISTIGIDFSPALASPNFTLPKIIQAAGVGVFLFVGFEWVTPLAEETTDYRLIGKGMLITVGILSILYSLFTVALWIGLTPEQRLSGTAIPHILLGRNLFGTPGVILLMFMSALASVTSFNAGVLNTSRFTYAMARDNVLPKMFSNLHPDYATPWVAILGLSIFSLMVSVVIFITGKYLFIILMAAALECFIYSVMAICVLRLRKRYPDKPRDFKVPFGAVIPVITAVVFLGLMVGIFMDVTKDYAGRVLFANYWLAVVMAGFFVLCILYTMVIVPVFKKEAAERSATRQRRRPGREDKGVRAAGSK